MTLPASDHPILKHLEGIRASMLARDKRLLNKIIREYAKAYKALKADIDKLIAMVIETEPERILIGEIAATRNLLDGIRAEIKKFAQILGDELSESALLEIEQAGIDAFSMVQASLPHMERARLIGTWTRVVPEQVYSMFGFVDPDGPLYSVMQNQLGPDIAAQVRTELMQGYIKGQNPRRVASAINKAISSAMGKGLTWAMNTARTANLWSYRAASHANYIKNNAVVKGWIWHSNLNDERTCMGCIAEHGNFYPLEEFLNDHHMGRCTALPVTKTYAELGIKGIPDDKALQIPSGETWFNALPSYQQKAFMGGAKYRAWKDGAFSFDQLTTTYESQIYGTMKREASLKEILGLTKAQQYYK
jgi:hypothetical protein